MADPASGLLKRMGRKIHCGVIGTIVCVAGSLWTGGCGGSGSDYERLGRLPGEVFGGGAGKLTFNISLNQPGQLSATFEPNSTNDPGIHVQQSLSARRHYFEVDMAADTYGFIEVTIADAQPGASINWTVQLDGKDVSVDSVVRENAPATDGGVFVQLEFSSVAEMMSYMPVD